MITSIYLLHVIIGFIFGFLVCTITIKEHVASRDNLRGKIVGGGVIILAALAVLVGVQQTQANNQKMQDRITCEANDSRQEEIAHSKLMAAQEDVIKTPIDLRTKDQYEKMNQAFMDYEKVVSENRTDCLK